MNSHNERIQRLIQVARMYYEQDQTQSEIAAQLGVSRPLISRMLREARTRGIVDIRIHLPGGEECPAMAQAKQRFGIRGGILIRDAADDSLTNLALAESASDLISRLGGARLGIGWGHIIGVLVSRLEHYPPAASIVQHVCPMVGNSGISIRNYHSNENVRIIAHQMMAEPHYLYTPAFAESLQELDLLRRTEHYQAICREWTRLDTALVNIGNYPSTPDFATVARYGTLLSEKHAVGRLIAYYFNPAGEIIHSDSDYAIQIPLPLLTKCPNVIGVCSANVSRQALAGALRTGLITHIVAREQLLQELLADPWI